MDVQIPTIFLSEEILGLGYEESEAFEALTNKVREACDTYSCFLVDYSKITADQQEQLLKAIKSVFDLPQETKNQYKRPNPRDGGYMGFNPGLPFYETFAIRKPSEDRVQALSGSMWPQGNPNFCEAINSMNSKLRELFSIVLRMIFRSLSIDKYYTEQVEKTEFTLRASKYKAPPVGSDSGLGMVPHVDKDIFTLVCQNEVQGLEVQSKDGSWVKVDIPKGSWLVLLGNAFEIWSNGRFKGVKHRVMMSGEDERYAYVFYSFPKDGVTIDVPHELVDEEHPLLYKPFIYSDYLFAYETDIRPDTLKVYAGI